MVRLTKLRFESSSANAAVVVDESRKRMSPSATSSTAFSAMRFFADRLTVARSRYDIPPFAEAGLAARAKNATPPRMRSRCPDATSSATSRWIVAELTPNFSISSVSDARFFVLT